MKGKFKSLIIFTAMLILICFISIVMFTLSAPLELFSLSSGSKANIGTTIGGITTPIISIFSAVLVYLAFTAQTESNKNQFIKNESDVIFSLLEQFSNELGLFYYESNNEGTVIPNRGVEALNSYARQYRFGGNLSTASISFKQIIEAKYIKLYIDSFNLIKQRIAIANLSPELKELFERKLNSYYYAYLRAPLKDLVVTFDKFPNLNDSLTQEVKDLHLSQLNTY
jgi:hypothetical protein